MWRALTISIILLLFSVSKAFAVYDPVSVPNNHFGIHIIDEADLNDAATLVNSSGGDWGYVKLVMREDDRDRAKWQEVFDRMRRLHIIPIVRLATRVENAAWVKPKEEDISGWVSFLNSLNWVVENRYIVLFNEPNHAKEWGDTLEPEEYARIAVEFSKQLKAASEDFFVLPAGLDASAPQTHETLDERIFLQRMLTAVPDFFDHIDGWASHSYPNPAFSGSPWDTGRGSIKTYQWELGEIAHYTSKRLPVFITETGWQHADGKSFVRGNLSPEQVASNFQVAYEVMWQDPRIVAVLPFLLNYQDVPFDTFSWRKINSSAYHEMYETVLLLDKIKATPRQHESATMQPVSFPEALVVKSEYRLALEIENTGQSIIDRNQWHLEVTGLPKSFSYVVDDILRIEPFRKTRVQITIHTPDTPGLYSFEVHLVKEDKTFAIQKASIALLPPPAVVVFAKTWLRNSKGSDYELLIYDDQERLIHKVAPLTFDGGFAEIAALYDIVPGREYRLVLTKPYYLPRQVHAVLNESKTAVSFPTLLPFDPSGEGELNFGDVGAFFRAPLPFFQRVFAL